jgi:hypothetical protein
LIFIIKEMSEVVWGPVTEEVEIRLWFEASCGKRKKKERERERKERKKEERKEKLLRPI